MVERDYVDFCNFANNLNEQAKKFFAQLSDEHVYQLGGVVRNEIAAPPGGKVAPAYDFLAAALDEETAERSNVLRNVVNLPKRCENDLTF